MGNEDITDLDGLLERIAKTDAGERVTLGSVLRAVGSRSFGPLLVVVGLVTISPLGNIPGTPTLMAAVVLLIAVQMLARRDHPWLPAWLLRRSVSRSRFQRATRFMRRPARAIDRVLRPRLPRLTHGRASYGMPAAMVVVAAAMPVTEFVPFTGTVAGWAVTFFGLALIAHDGVIALCGYATALLLVAGIVYPALMWAPWLN